MKELHFHKDLSQVYCQLSREQPDSLLERPGPQISRMRINFREPMSPTELLAISLRRVIYVPIKGDITTSPVFDPWLVKLATAH